MQTIKIEQWNVDKFIKVSGNPIQRNTPMRARRANKLHLAVLHPSHSNVAVAKLGKQFIKLDGHTRALLWKQDKLDRPDTLNVSIYPCNDKQEVMRLYQTYDSPAALETKTDQIFGALGYHKIVVPVPSFVSMSGLAQAMRVIDIALIRPRQHEIIDLMRPHLSSIKALLSMSYIASTKHPDYSHPP